MTSHLHHTINITGIHYIGQLFYIESYLQAKGGTYEKKRFY